MAHGMRRMVFQPRSHQHQGGNTLQHLQHIKGGAVLKLVTADHDVHAALAHTLQPRLHAGGHIHQPSQGSAKADTTTCAWQALLSMRRTQMGMAMQGYWPNCKSRTRPHAAAPTVFRGQRPGYKYVGFIAVLCMWGVETRAARLPLCREVAQAHTIWNNIGLGVVLLCSVRRATPPGKPVFRAPRVCSPGASPCWGSFAAVRLFQARGPHAIRSFSVNQYLRQHIRTVPDWPAPGGVQFRDIHAPAAGPKRCSAC